MSNMDTPELCPSTVQSSDAGRRIAGCKTADCQGFGTPSCACRIRELNDKLRTTMCGGLIQMTNGIAALGLLAVNEIFQAISKFQDFNDNNDPHSEHDCAVMEAQGHRIIWKIDYYDRSRTYHSPDPADSKLTVRVMTVMLADEY